MEKKKEAIDFDELEDLEEELDGALTVDPEMRDQILKETSLDLTPEGRRKILQDD